MPIQKDCLKCAAPFSVSPSRASQRYCGDACSRTAGAATRCRPRPLRSCKECRADFRLPRPSSPRAFCSEACAQASRSRKLHGAFFAGRTSIACEACGTSVEVVDTESGRARRRFCSRQCADAAKVGAPAHNKTEGVTKPCAICAMPFRVPDCRGTTAKFCSYSCMAEAKRRVTGSAHPLFKGMADRICQWCQSPFQCKPAKVAYGEGKFCSRRCLGFSTSQAQGGRRSSIEIITEAWLVAQGEPFEAQRQIGPWLVDFYLPHRNLVIEVDGDYWHRKPKIMAKDRQKNGWMHRNGYQIVRIWEKAVRAADFSIILAVINTPQSDSPRMKE